MQQLESFKALIKSPKKIIITTHYKPDADALGSSLALSAYLKKKGHEVMVIAPSDYPEFLFWMEGHEEVINYEEDKTGQCATAIDEADIIFCLDFNCLQRLNQLGEYVKDSKAKKVLIDHHLEPEHFADYEFWTTEAAATTELVYELIVNLQDRHLIDKGIADCLYAGIMTDTGQFKHPNTTKNVHMVTADLIALGADVSNVAWLIYDNNSVDRMKFLGFAIDKRMTILSEYRTVFFAITAEDLKKFNHKTGDTEGLVNYGLSIQGIVFSALIIERPDTIRLSLRSRGEFSVNEFARSHFHGGGHANAAGGKSDIGLDETVKKFTQLLKSYKAELNKNYN
ncbi:MAG: DHH family phosphoesterase [Cyclobacteriaceae bacterium]|nr:DHH family phosphoesterase [Cyclobacteriaceae bacterium]